MYKSFIQPYFDYCSVVWEGMGSKLALKLRKLQNRAARTITFSSYESNFDPLLQEIRWDRLSIRRIRLLAIEMFKYLCQKSLKMRTMCFSSRFPLPLPQTNYQLPEDLRKWRSMNSFKSKLVNLLLLHLERNHCLETKLI